jgi:membrane protein
MFRRRREVLDVGGLAVRRWLGGRTPQLAAALAFHAVLAMAPLLLVLLAVAGRFLGREAARQGVSHAAGRVAGLQAERVAEGMVELITASEWRTTSAVLGFGLLLLFASSFFVQLRSALNAVWGTTHRGFRQLLLRRLLSLGEMLVAVTIAMLVLAVGVLRSVAFPLLQARGFGVRWAWVGVSHLGTLLGTVLVLGAAYAYLPEVKPRPSRDAVLAGALPAAVILGVFSHVSGRFISASALASLFGAASSVIVALLWMYYSAWILLLGAEICRAWDEVRSGTHDRRRA